jgi:hypothetical protein
MRPPAVRIFFRKVMPDPLDFRQHYGLRGRKTFYGVTQKKGVAELPRHGYGLFAAKI